MFFWLILMFAVVGLIALMGYTLQHLTHVVNRQGAQIRRLLYENRKFGELIDYAISRSRDGNDPNLSNNLTAMRTEILRNLPPHALTF